METRKKLNITLAIIVRLVLIAQCAVSVQFAICIIDSYYYLFLLINIIVIIFDGLYVCVKRHGRDYKWIQVIGRGSDATATNSTDCDSQSLSNIASNDSLCIRLDFTVCKFIEVFIQIFLITLVLSRWLLPSHASISRDAISALLLTFISAGSDIVDFFSIQNDSYMDNNLHLVYAILALFCISIFQFSVTLTAKRDKKAEINDEKRINKGFYEKLNYVFGNESWSVALICLTQDFPFLVVRLYVLITYIEKIQDNFTIYFFTIKNAILVMLEIYRIISLCIEENTVEPLNEKNNEQDVATAAVCVELPPDPDLKTEQLNKQTVKNDD